MFLRACYFVLFVSNWICFLIFDIVVLIHKCNYFFGLGVVVKGFDMGVASMKKGEKAVFTFKSDYAYGASGSPPNIPPNATLIFEASRIKTRKCWENTHFSLFIQIELLDWKPEDLSPRSNGGILRHVIKKPITRKTPNDGASVTGNYQFYSN